jgi:flagellar basal body-associated protein FliL
MRAQNWGTEQTTLMNPARSQYHLSDSQHLDLQGMTPMHKKWLYRLILSYLPILFAVVFCLIILFFLTLNEAMERQTAKANGVYAENVLQIVDTTLRNLETTTIKSLLLDDQVSSLF